jgi:hypothetical protein
MRLLSQLPGSFKALSVLLALASAAAFCCAIVFAPPSDPVETALACLVLSVLALVAESLAVEFTDRITLTASNLPILLAIMFLGPGPAVVVAAVAGLWGCWRERSFFISLFNVANISAAAAVAALAFLFVQRSTGFEPSAVSPAFLGAGVIAAATYEFTNMAAVGIAARLMYQRSLGTYWSLCSRPLAS